MNVWITVLAVSFGLLAAGLYVVVRRLRRRILELEVHSARAEQRATAIAEQCEQERRRVEALELSSAEAAQRERALIEQRSASAERVKVLEQALKENEQGQKRIQEYITAQFKTLASDILEQKSRQLKDTGEQSLEKILAPLRSSIKEFRERVESIHTEDTKQRSSLDSQIRALGELNRRIGDEAAGLTRALKGSSKVQGDWGEMVLETILEGSGLQRGVHYFPQESFKSESGDNLRPDFVLRLPEGKQIVIDSKVSLTAFTEWVNCEQEPERFDALKRHLASVRRHVRELGDKEYQNGFSGASPDFVIMFIPNEPAFMAAMQNDASLWNEAYKCKVVISSPTNLFSLLKIVDDVWKRDAQNRNAQEIAERGKRLYDKLVGFISSLEEVGKGLDNARRSYDSAYSQLAGGRGNLVRQAEQLRELGVKPAKSLPPQLVDMAQSQPGQEDDSE